MIPKFLPDFSSVQFWINAFLALFIFAAQRIYRVHIAAYTKQVSDHEKRHVQLEEFYETRRAEDLQIARTALERETALFTQALETIRQDMIRKDAEIRATIDLMKSQQRDHDLMLARTYATKEDVAVATKRIG